MRFHLKRGGLLACLLLLLLAPLASAQTASPVVGRVRVPDSAALSRLLKLGLDLLEMRQGDQLFFLTTAKRLDKLRAAGWDVQIDAAQTALLAQHQQTRTFSGGYRTVAEIRAFCDDAAAQHPQLAQVFIYGDSWERTRNSAAGHELFGITLTNRTRPGPKPTFFLMASIHAREIVTPELALRFVSYLLDNYGSDGDATWLLDEHQIVVVPVANPDGHVLAEAGYYQRKNTDDTHGSGCAEPPDIGNQFGVDLNRNSSFQWGVVNPPSEDPCGQTYPGPSAASEPETAAIQTLVASLFADQRGPLDSDAAPDSTTGLFLTLHSYSNLVLWPWGHTTAPAPNAAGLALIGGKFAGYNSYTAEQSTGLYPTSGTTDDWAYGTLGIPAFTFEVGLSSGACGGFFPPYSCLDGGTGGAFWTRNLPAFLYAARIARTPYQLVQGPTVEALTATTATGGYRLRARLNETRNGGQNVAAAEYYVDVPPWRGGTPTAMAPTDGAYDSTIDDATALVAGLSGRHLLYVRGCDAAGHWGPVRAVFTPGQPCAYDLSPGSESFPASGGSGSVAVTAGIGCAWTATSNAAFLSITSGAAGAGDGMVSYTVAPHANPAARSGTLTIASQTFTVTQAGTEPPVDLSVDDVAVSEGANGTTAIFTVSLSAASSQTVSVHYATADGTAMAPADYTAVPDTVLTFTPGQTSQTVTVGINGDTLDEPDETLFINLSNATNATITASQGIGTITDDDPAPTLAINDVTVAEGDSGTANAVFTVSLSTASGQTVTVHYATANGTTTAPADYITVPDTVLTYLPGETSKTVTVTVNGDTLDELNETFKVNLSGPVSATIADGQGMGTITDDDPAPTLSINDVTVTEGTGGTVNAVFTVSLAAASGQTVTVHYATADSTATAPADYGTRPDTVLTFTPGQISKTLLVAITGDKLDEPNETFFVNLSTATNATIADGQGVGTITDNDAAPTLALNDVTVAEGDSGTTNAVFTVSLSAASGQTVTVHYATANGSATAPADYIAVPDTVLTYLPGETSKIITVAVNGDTLDELNETFKVNLSSPVNASIADGQGVGTITDDDPAPTLSINDATVLEGNGGTTNLSFTVSLAAASSLTVTVHYSTADGTATAPADYGVRPDTVLTFTPGQTSKTLLVGIKGDKIDEPNETFFVNLSTAANATIADGQGVGTILNDDATQ